MKCETWFVHLLTNIPHQFTPLAPLHVYRLERKGIRSTYMYSAIVTHKYILKAQTFYNNATQESNNFSQEVNIPFNAHL